MDNDGQTSWGTISAVAFLTTAIGSIFLFGGPLESQRPNQQGAMVPAGEEEVVSARLWQDPLEAVYSHWGRVLAHAETNKKLPLGMALPDTIRGWAAKRRSRPSELHLFVMAPGTPYAEDVENRRRQRYAVVTALAELDYAPKNADRIGYFVAPDFADSSSFSRPTGPAGCALNRLASGEPPSVPANPASGCMIIGFEEFEPPSNGDKEQAEERGSIIVFWLNEEDFRSNGLNRIAALMAALNEGIRATSDNPLDNAEHTQHPTSVLVGQNTSGTLKSFMDGTEDHAGRDSDGPSRFLERSRAFPESVHVLFDEGEPDSASARFFRNLYLASLGECPENVPPDDVGGSFRCRQSRIEPEFRTAPDRATEVAENRASAKADGRRHRPAQSVIDAHRRKLHVLSTLATVPLDVLFDNPDYRIDNVARGPAIETRLAIDLKVASFASLVARDDLVLAGVLHELTARGACSDEQRGGKAPCSGESCNQTACGEESCRENPRTNEPCGEGPCGKTACDNESVSDEACTSTACGRNVCREETHTNEPCSDGACGKTACDKESGGGGPRCKNRPILAVVSEQDTVYGRQLARIIRDLSKTARSQGRCAFEVREFGYLAGVDGEALPTTTGRGVSRNPAANGDPAQDRTVNNANLRMPFGPDDTLRERAVGDAQLDYVRRLADLIDQANADGSGGFAAIGVLGSDVYDKQLILQALRERLPSSTFFTTDLDARLTDPAVNRSTRNLIVGSAYGLSAQGQQAAGFRDTYQTALYRAVHLAHELSARPETPDQRQTCRILGDPYLCAPSPKLFEIGLTAAVDITECRQCCAHARCIHGEAGHITLDPGSWTKRLKASFGVFVPLVILIAVSGFLWWKLDPERLAFRCKAHKRVVALGSISLVILAAAVVWWTRPGYEPWAFYEGVSTVPTLVLEISTLLFSVALILIVLGRTQQGDRDTAAEFRLSGKRSEQKTLTFSDWLPRRIVLKEREPQGSLPIDCVWDAHRKNGAWHTRLPRILVPVIVLSVLTIVVFETHPEPLLSRHLDLAASVIRGAMIVAALAAVFFCTDALKLERALIRNLAWHDIEGFEGTLGTSGLDPSILQRRRAMDLIVHRTEMAGPIVVLPFLLLPFLMLARSTVFEGWVWTWTILGLYAAFGVYLFVNALLFQTEAARARDWICERLGRHRYDVKTNKLELRQINLMIDDIYDNRQGAFVRWTSHPILQSLALVVGGLGLIALLNFLF